MINKMKIDEAFEFYNIDKSYKEECYRCIEEINRSENYKNICYKLCKYGRSYNL